MSLASAAPLFHVKQFDRPSADSVRQLEDDLKQLQDRLHRIDACIEDRWMPPLWEYACLLLRWSRRMNLVSPGDRTQIFTKHIGPAYLMAELVKSVPHATVVDYGSGAGLPGIPLKIVFPHSLFYLVEVRRKRASFLQAVIRTLGLTKVSVINQRLEDWTCPSGPVDLVVSRATAGTDLASQVRAHVAPDGSILTTLPSIADPKECPFPRVRREFPGFPTMVLFGATSR
jgi:16S rRNA (guanine(527)-N(7))-methyltransferase RsmG